MKKNKLVVWGIVVVTGVSLVGLSGLFSLSPGGSSPNQNQQGSNNSGVPCLFSGAFHIHPRLTILVDGKTETPPTNVGILPGCTREIHTHQPDGVIHVEGPVDKGYTFADFMGVWDESLERPGYTLKITVDGQEVSDPNFVMKDGQQIVLEYTRI